MISTFLEKQIVRKVRATPKPPRWENLDNGSWIHPKWGVLKKVTAGHKFKFDWWAYPEELNPLLKFGPFLNRTDATQALKDFHAE